MGRPVRYHTATERNSAQRVIRANYEKTARAKALRKAQNRRAYERRRAPTTSALKLPYIPLPIRRLASLPLPTSSRSFQSQSRSTSDVPNEHYAQWDQYPPYINAFPIPVRDLEVTSAALHGYHFNIQYRFEQQRIARYNRLPLADFMEEVHRDLLAFLNQAKELKDLLGRFKSSTDDYKMGTHLLQWKARRIMALVDDWKALKAGNDKFITVFANRW